MEAFAGGRLLELWEQGRGLHPVDRALLLLGVAMPQESFESLAELTIGERDAALLALRRGAFGARLPAYADCPRCAERLELALDADALVLGPPAAAGDRTVRLESADRFRLPTTRDLAQVANEPTPDRAARRLAALCHVAGEAAPADWSDEQLAELEARFADADPQADIELDLACECCGHTWRSAFDIGAFLWEELEARAVRLLAEVHALARYYGWSERDILELSEARRALYLELARS